MLKEVCAKVIAAAKTGDVDCNAQFIISTFTYSGPFANIGLYVHRTSTFKVQWTMYT